LESVPVQEIRPDCTRQPSTVLESQSRLSNLCSLEVLVGRPGPSGPAFRADGVRRRPRVPPRTARDRRVSTGGVVGSGPANIWTRHRAGPATDLDPPQSWTRRTSGPATDLDPQNSWTRHISGPATHLDPPHSRTRHTWITLNPAAAESSKARDGRPPRDDLKKTFSIPLPEPRGRALSFPSSPPRGRRQCHISRTGRSAASIVWARRMSVVFAAHARRICVA
jgi:hypothetical protein